MRGVPLIRASALAPFIPFLEEVGVAIDSLLPNIGLPATGLSQPEALVPMHQVGALLHTVARRQGLTHLGYIVGERTSIKDALGSLGKRVAGSFSLHEALHTLVGLFPTFGTSGRLRLAVEEGRMWLRHTQDRRIERGWREAEQFDVMLMIDLVRLTSHRRWRPREVQLRAQREAGLEKIEALAEARITFGNPSTGIEIPSSLLPESLVGARPAPFGREQIDAPLPPPPPAVDFPGSVRQIVATLLRDGYPDVRQTAAAIGMSVRTLQRRLSEGGVSYSRVVERERLRAAEELLAQPRLRITDVAIELGYQDLANFTHAFHRWTGLTPSEYRRHESETSYSRARRRQ